MSDLIYIIDVSVEVQHAVFGEGAILLSFVSFALPDFFVLLFEVIFLKNQIFFDHDVD